MRQTLDGSGAVLAATGYDPWGTPQQPLTTPFGFTGELQQQDRVQLRARWYDPGNGTFPSRDPFAGFTELPYSLHPYQYAYSAPITWVDPSGHQSVIGDSQYRHRYAMEITVDDIETKAEVLNDAIDQLGRIQLQREVVVTIGTFALTASTPIGIGTITARIAHGGVAAGVTVSADVAVTAAGFFSVADMLDPQHNIAGTRTALQNVEDWMNSYSRQMLNESRADITIFPAMTLWLEDRSVCYHGDTWEDFSACPCTFGLREDYVIGADWPGAIPTEKDTLQHPIDKRTYNAFRAGLSWDIYTKTDFGSPMRDWQHPPM